MKRSTWITLSVFIALLGLYFVQTRSPAPNAPAALSIDGYIGNFSEQEARSAAKDKPSPVTRIVLKRQGEVIQLDRQPQEPPPPDAKPDAPKPETKWTAQRTKNGKTTQSQALSFRAQSMSESLMRSIRSSFSLRVQPKALADYGLDAEHAMDVEITLPPRTVKLRVGHVDKPEQGEPSTWIQDPAHLDVVHQVAGRDLRTSFDVAWSDLRDKSLLSIDPAAVLRAELDIPTAPKAPRIVIERAVPAGSGGEAGSAWKISEPIGYSAGDIDEWLKSIGRVSASEFIDVTDAAAKKMDTGLDDTKTAARVTVVTDKGKTVLVFGKSDESRPAREVWLRIDGRDELFLVPTFSRDQIVQGIDQLRDRHLLAGHKAANALSFRIEPSGDAGRIKAARKGDAWSVIEPTMQASGKSLTDFLGELDAAKVEFAGDKTAAETGLDAPTWRMALELDGETWTIALGKEVEGSTFGRVSHGAVSGDIFKLASWNANRLKKKPADFEDKPAPPAPPAAP